MWMYFSDAFLSVVRDETVPAGDMLLVRSRFEGDIERVFPDVDVRRTDDCDYLFRVSIHRGTVAEAIATRIWSIEYPNLKDSVAMVDGRLADYSATWHVMASGQAERLHYQSDVDKHDDLGEEFDGLNVLNETTEEFD